MNARPAVAVLLCAVEPILQGSNLPFLVWYKTIFLMTATKKGFSSKEIQKQLGLKHYKPVWAIGRVALSQEQVKNQRFAVSIRGSHL